MSEIVKALKGLISEYRARITEDEVMAQVSRSIWKTRNRILEEIEAKRTATNKKLAPHDGFWFSPRIDVRNTLTRMYIRGEVEVKDQTELTAGEVAWASTSDSDADQREAAERDGKLLFYRFSEVEGRRNRNEAESPEEMIEPVVVSF